MTHMILATLVATSTVFADNLCAAHCKVRRVRGGEQNKKSS